MPAFEMTHETTVGAPPTAVHELIDDFRNWVRWSPWEEKDPQLERTYSGADSGTGAIYSWKGNKQVGSGRMEITSSEPERIELDLEFFEPFQSSSKTVFTFTPGPSGTRVAWTMSGNRGVLMGVAGKLFVDRALGKDFDRGLAKLKSAAEQSAGA